MPRTLAALSLLPLFLFVSLARSAEPSEPVATTSRPVSFNRDIRPIMSDTCFHCHGFDAKARKAGMRLDLRDEALKPTKNGVLPIVPGKPDESEIILRIFDDQEPMPPEEAHKTLTREQKEVFRRWVKEGAVYEPHWAYAPLVKPAAPAGANPIDGFVRARLAEKKLPSAPEADKPQLLRRLSLDLIGLPPTPEEVAAFVADRSPDAHARQVDRLLSSPHHGERMAAWWLDVARFADTVGFHGDQNQRIFPYRDYVINAFNTNKRFDQFTIEQLAGDLLPNPTTEQRVATGYNRLNMMTREGGAQAKEYLAKYGAERVRSVAAAWFGSTFGCAECHDHKFDPIKSRDFYELQSFFADMKQWGIYSDYAYTPNPELAGFTNDHPFPPEIEVDSPYLHARAQRLETELAAVRNTAAAQSATPENAPTFAAWLREARAFLEQNPSGWNTPAVAAAHVKGKMATPLAVGEDGVVRLAQDLKRGESLRLTLRPGPARLAALRLDILDAAADQPARAMKRAPLKLAASVRSQDGKEQKLEFVFADATEHAPVYENGAELIGVLGGWKLPSAPSASRQEPASQLSTPSASTPKADANSAAPRQAVWLLKQPRVLPEGAEVVVTITGDAVPPLRVAVSPFAAVDPLSSASDAVRKAVLAAVDARPAARDAALLAETWLLSTASLPELFTREHALAAEWRATRNGKAWTLVTQPAEPLVVRVLPRGNWQDETGPVVLPATPSFLPGRLESTADHRLTRLDLARWIVSPANPITARTVMNRVWAMFFGTGLSAKLDDLGSQGELPSHPELLEWLAAEFRESGWDLRHMIRLIVTSATYRQSSSLPLQLREIDPANRLLAAQSPRRLDAEFVRDNALAIAGLLNLRDIGGPSVKPYQPPGYYAALQFPNRDYEPSHDDEQWRRGVYMHWQRTFLHPMLANFDAPARDECAAQRVVSNTPQQALTLLNDPTFVEAARTLAARLLREANDDSGRVRRAYLLALSREPKPAELSSLTKFLAAQREHYRANAAEAAQLGRVGYSPPPKGDAIELAAWTNVARVILNTQEVITRY